MDWVPDLSPSGPWIQGWGFWMNQPRAESLSEGSEPKAFLPEFAAPEDSAVAIFGAACLLFGFGLAMDWGAAGYQAEGRGTGEEAVVVVSDPDPGLAMDWDAAGYQSENLAARVEALILVLDPDPDPAARLLNS